MVVVLALATCVQPATTIQSPNVVETTPAPATPTTPAEPASPPATPQEEPTMKLLPIPIYPAYYREDGGNIYGIPADLQGMSQKEKIDVLQEDGSPAPVTDFYVYGRDIYLEVRYNTPPEGDMPVEHTEFFVQALGSADIVGAENVLPCPEPASITAQLAGFTIETGTYDGQPVSEIWNKDPAFVATTTPKGCGPFRYPMVSAYAQQDAGLLFAVEDAGLYFIPQRRSAADQVAEAGRLWR